MITKTTIAAALTALTLAATLAIPTTEAQAGNGFYTGLAVGAIGGAVLGAGMANAGYGYGYGPGYVSYGYGYRSCRFVRQYDAYGFYVGTARVCNYY